VDRARLVIPLVVPLLWIAAPIEAGAQQAPCPDGVSCVWNQTHFQGSRTKVPPSGCIDTNIASAVNASDKVLVFFINGGCVGARAGTLQPGEDTSQTGAESASNDCSPDPVGPCGSEPPEPTSP
jgi:hypothetical protein